MPRTDCKPQVAFGFHRQLRVEAVFDAPEVSSDGGLLLLRKGLAAAWKKVTGRVPPTDLTDPKVTLPEALAWGVATGIIVETARFFIVRSTMRRPASDESAKSS